MTTPFIALDSNCLTYLIDALDPGVAEPTDRLADERKALVRLYVYTTDTLWTVPTVEREFEKITNPERLARHRSWTERIFPVYQRLNDPERVRFRAKEFGQFHNKPVTRAARDCFILAEAEDIGFTALLSYDNDFVNRLATRSRTSLIRPSEYWSALAVPTGAGIRNAPRHDNPLSRETWWRW